MRKLILVAILILLPLSIASGEVIREKTPRGYRVYQRPNPVPKIYYSYPRINNYYSQYNYYQVPCYNYGYTYQPYSYGYGYQPYFYNYNNTYYNQPLDLLVDP
jgi:hypothetical protein